MPNGHKFPWSGDLLLLLLIWCGALALVNPIGDFPLNDDWAYGQNTRALAVENRLYFSDWPAMTLLAHTLWGSLFCKIFGFSFTVLRFSTLLMALFGLAGFYQLLTWLQLPRRTVWGSMLLLAFNPLWFVLANSYMTDVPFLSVLLWSTLYFLKTLEKPTLASLLAATFFALWACFIRQLGLIAPGIFLLLFLYYQPINWKNIFYALFPLVACYIALEVFNGWLERSGQLPEAYRGLGHLWRSAMTMTGMFPIASERIGVTLMTVGLFLLPFSVGIIPVFQDFMSRKKLMRRGWLLLSGIFFVWSAWNVFPYGNVFFNLGLGPKLLNDAIWGEHADPKLPETILFVVKCMAVTGAGLLLLALGQSGDTTDRQKRASCYSLLFCLPYLCFICLNSLLIDRYFLVYIPLLLILQGICLRNFSNSGFVMTGLLALFSVAATHDYLAWNRARWQAARQLQEQGVPPEKMDGGFEFNGWHLPGIASQRTQGLKSWWFVREDDWVIAFGPVWGYDVIQTMPYQRWLPPGPDTIFVNRRKAYMISDSAWCSMEFRSADSTRYAPEAGSIEPGNGASQTVEKARSGRFSMCLTPTEPFGATILLDTFQKYDRLTISIWRYPADAEAGIVVAADDAAKGYFFEPSHIVERDSAGWGRLEMALTLPATAVGNKGRFYLWNPSSHQTVWFDDLKFYRLQAK